MLALDGVFVEQLDGSPPRFKQLPHLTSSEVADLVTTIRVRVLALLIRRGVVEDTTAQLVLLPDERADDEPVLAQVTTAAVSGLPPAGPARREREPLRLARTPGASISGALCAADMGFTSMFGPEAEFFLFQKGEDRVLSPMTHDAAGYFDLTPVDRGEDCRRAIVDALEAMGFEVEAAHHEVAPGQHEIDFKFADAVKTADNVATFRFVVRKIAVDFNLHATFMPKPIHGVNGSGMHCHQSLFKGSANAFYGPRKQFELSTVALQYIAGLLEHSRGFVAVTNPIVNSFKRLVPGFEAPTNVAWSMRNRSPMIRIPERRGTGTRCEVRLPDPSCNPYLAFAVMLASGLDGIERKLEPPPPVNKCWVPYS